MKLKIFSDGLTGGNSYLLSKKGQAVLIDPGFNGQKIIAYCQEKAILIKHVILTHGHHDHIRDLRHLVKIFSFDLSIHAQDYPFLFDPVKSYASAFGTNERLNIEKIVIHQIKQDETRTYLDEQFKLLSTPGHTAGSICILYQKMLFSGDTLFYDSVGRTDLFSGSSTAMHHSLKKLEAKISDQVTVYPGHGRHGLMAEIKAENYYLR